MAESNEILSFDICMEKNHIYDYVFFHTYGKLRGKLFVAVGVIALFMLGMAWNQYQVFHRILLGFVGCFYLVIQPIFVYRTAKRLAGMPQFSVPIHYEFGEEEVTVCQGEESVVYRWEDGFRFVSRPKEILMYVSAREAYVIPKNQAQDAWRQILLMAQQHHCPIGTR